MNINRVIIGDEISQKTIILAPCEDGAETVEFIVSKFNFDPNKKTEYWCELNFMDHYCGVKESKLRYRIKRAISAFKGDPVYHTGIVITDMDRAKQFFNDCVELITEVEEN